MTILDLAGERAPAAQGQPAGRARYNRVRQGIGAFSGPRSLEHGELARKVSGTDVAQAAGVSQTTVSFVLSGRTDVTIPEATRERVRKAARALGYRPNGVARSLARGCTRTIGVIVPRVDSSFCGQIAQGIQEVCIASDYRVLLAHTLHRPKVEAHQVGLFLEHRVDGLICVVDEWTIADLPRTIAGILDERVPCVLIDDHALSDRVDCVVSDDRHGACLAVRHLLALGHRRIAHLSGGERTTPALERTAGYREALREAGIRFDRTLVAGKSFSMHDAAAALHDLLDRKNPPTALFTANDRLAAEAKSAVEERGLRVPDDVAIVGYADMELAHYLKLTTIRQDAAELGRVAVQRLLQRIASPELPPETLVVPTRLVVRQSCGSAARAAAVPPHPANRPGRS
jgi:LacI family transcriptional regulator